MVRGAFCFALAALVSFAVTSARQGQGAELRLGSRPLELRAGRGSLRVLTCDRGCSGEARQSVIDPQTGKVVARYRGRVGVSLAVADGRLWTVTRDGTLRRLRN